MIYFCDDSINHTCMERQKNMDSTRLVAQQNKNSTESATKLATSLQNSYKDLIAQKIANKNASFYSKEDETFCASYMKNAPITIEFELKMGNVYKILGNGHIIGSYILNRENDTVVSLSMVSLHKDLQGKGVGKKFYKELAQQLYKNEKRLLKSDTTNDNSRRVWESLVYDGTAEKIEQEHATGVQVYSFIESKLKNM